MDDEPAIYWHAWAQLPQPRRAILTIRLDLARRKLRAQLDKHTATLPLLEDYDAAFMELTQAVAARALAIGAGAPIPEDP